LEAISQLVHQLAGSGASLGFASVSTAATRVEAAVLHMLATNDRYHQPNERVAITASEDLDTLLTFFYEAVRASATEPPQWRDINSTSAADNA
jgi:HPt (histidine-containing phosphotransfer) domain-containing protein